MFNYWSNSALSVQAISSLRSTLLHLAPPCLLLLLVPCSLTFKTLLQPCSSFHPSLFCPPLPGPSLSVTVCCIVGSLTDILPLPCTVMPCIDRNFNLCIKTLVLEGLGEAFLYCCYYLCFWMSSDTCFCFLNIAIFSQKRREENVSDLSSWKTIVHLLFLFSRNLKRRVICVTFIISIIDVVVALVIVPVL